MMKRLLTACFFVWFMATCFTSTADAAEIKVHAQAGVDKAVAEDTILAVRNAIIFCDQAFSMTINQPVQIVITADTKSYQAEIQKEFGVDELSAARWARTTAAVSGNYKIIRNGAAATSYGDRIFLVAHEMVHIYQRQIGFPTCSWLVEGMADAIATHVVENVGRRSVAEYRRGWETMLAGQPEIPDLSELQSRDGWTRSIQHFGTPLTYRTAGMTVLQLWDENDWDHILAFYRASIQLGPEAAFQQVFGYPLTDFQLKCRLERAS